MNAKKQVAKMIGNGLVAQGTIGVLGTGGYTVNPSMVIHMSSGVDDGAYYPASDISVYGKDAVTDLRDFCNEILAEEKPKEGAQ